MRYEDATSCWGFDLIGPVLMSRSDMNANRYKYFRWTPRTAWITFVYVVAVPSVVGYIGFMTDVSLRTTICSTMPPTRGNRDVVMLEHKARKEIESGWLTF